MDSMTTLLDGIALVCGFYCLYTWGKLLFTKKLFQNGLLVPKDKTVKDCSDEAAYIRYTLPRLGVLSWTTMIYGILFTLSDVLVSKGQDALLAYPYNFIPLALVMGVLIWYAVCNSKANREYFGM